jgi:hypothetical protein
MYEKEYVFLVLLDPVVIRISVNVLESKCRIENILWISKHHTKTTYGGLV